MLAANPGLDPSCVRNAKRQDALERAQRASDRKQADRDDAFEEKQFRSEMANVSASRRKEAEADNRALRSSTRQAANAIQRQLMSDPILRRAKANAERQQRLQGSGGGTLFKKGPAEQ